MGLRVYLQPTGLHSRSMLRFVEALIKYIPPDKFTIAASPSHLYADLILIHAIGYDAIEIAQNAKSKGQKYVVIQYCLESTEYTKADDWFDFWRNAEMVMSYYDLSIYQDQSINKINKVDMNFYRAPLGLDLEFTKLYNRNVFRDKIITSGYVSGQMAEAIEEVWLAAREINIPVTHIGPSNVQGIQDSSTGSNNSNNISSYPTFEHNISDERLAYLYRTALWVSGLRHKEGFELPAAEGLACGARPILFDNSNYRYWYRNRAIYVEDCHGQQLVDKLIEVFKRQPREVDENERIEILRRFNWEAVCKGFWSTLLRELSI